MVNTDDTWSFSSCKISLGSYIIELLLKSNTLRLVNCDIFSSKDVILLPDKSKISNFGNVNKSDGIKWISLLLKSNLISLDRFAFLNSKVSSAMLLDYLIR